MERAVSLRGTPVEQTATLPDGRTAVVRVAVPDDPYIPRSELSTVDVELRVGDEVLAAVNTILSPEQEHEAHELAREIVKGLESGELEPTAGAIEPLADSLS
jgi:ribosomal protein S1